MLRLGSWFQKGCGLINAGTASQGRVHYANLLLARTRGRQEVADFAEPRRGLTALGIACVYSVAGSVWLRANS